MHSDHAIGIGRRRGDQVEVEGRGVGCQDGIGAGEGAQPFEHLALHVQILEDGLDDQRRIRRRLEADLGLEERQLLVAPLLTETTPVDRASQFGRDGLAGGVDPILRHVDEHHADAGAQQGECDATTHRAGADHRGRIDDERRCPVGQAPGVAFRLEPVAGCSCRRRCGEALEQLEFMRKTRVEGEGCCRAQRVEGGQHSSAGAGIAACCTSCRVDVGFGQGLGKFDISQARLSVRRERQ